MTKSTIIFLKYTKKNIKKNFFFKKNKYYLLAYSGGQDSICLLIIFFILQKQFQMKLYIIFCNHLWQKDNFITFVHILKICFFFKFYIVQSITTIFLFNENQSRNWRFEIFSKFLFFFNFSGILIGHSVNDRTETFFLNLFRGSGVFGVFSLQKKNFFINLENFTCFSKNSFTKFVLKKQKFSKKNNFFKKYKIKKKFFFLEKKDFFKVFLFRPLIYQTRNELKNFLIRLKLPLYSDLTNKEIFFARNRVRKQLIPSIQFFFNKQITLTIQNYQNSLQQNEEEILKFANKFYKKIIFENKNFYFIDFQIFKKLPSTIQKNLLLFFFKYKVKKNFTFLNFHYFFFLIKNSYLIKKSEKLTKTKIFFGIGIFFFRASFLIFLK